MASKVSFITFISRLPWPVPAAVSAGGIVVFLISPKDGFVQFCGLCAALLGGISATIAFVEPKPQARAAQTPDGPEALRKLELEDLQSVVAGAYGRLGYDVIDDPERGGAHGVDIRLFKDGRLYLVQTEHWREEITQAMAAELCADVAAEKAARGIMVTTAGISAEARGYAQDKPLELIDGPGLCRLVAGPESARVSA